MCPNLACNNKCVNVVDGSRVFPVARAQVELVGAHARPMHPAMAASVVRAADQSLGDACISAGGKVQEQEVLRHRFQFFDGITYDYHAAFTLTPAKSREVA